MSRPCFSLILTGMPVTRRVDLSAVKTGMPVNIKLKQGRDKRFRVMAIEPKH